MNLPAPAPANLPLNYTQACKAVADCWRVDECKGWADKAAAVAAYAKMVRNVQLEVDAKRIRLRATRRIGELIGADGNIASHPKGAKFGGCAIAPETSQLPIGLRTASRAIARIPETEFENVVNSKDPPSVSLLAYSSHTKRSIENSKIHKKLACTTHRRASSKYNQKAVVSGTHVLLDFMINRQPSRNLPVAEVIDWARRYHQISGAFILLLENHDRERRVGDCVDEAMADQALAACKKVDSI